MRNRTKLIVAGAALAVAALSWPKAAAAQEAGQPEAGRQAQQPAGTAQTAADARAAAVRAPQFPQGVTVKEAADAEDIRDVLASATEAVLTKDGFDDLVERLVDADRNRLGKNMPSEEQLGTLNGRIDQIRKAWRDKYGQDFDIDNEEAVYTRQFIGIAQGEVQDPQALSRNWPVPPVQPQAAQVAGARTTDDAAQPAAAPERRAEAGEDAIEQRNLERGREVGLVRLADGHGLPGLTLSLIRENPDVWRIDVPDGVQAQRLHDNLLKHLTQVGEQSANWPSDKNEAFRQVSHRVLMALLDVDAEPSGEAAGAKKAR